MIFIGFNEERRSQRSLWDVCVEMRLRLKEIIAIIPRRLLVANKLSYEKALLNAKPWVK